MYCQDCQRKRKLPKSNTMVITGCQYCSEQRMCYERPKRPTKRKRPPRKRKA